MGSKILRLLEQRKNSGLARKTCSVVHLGKGDIEIEGKRYRNLSSNDYLGLASHPRLRDAARHGESDVVSSSSASPLITGRSVLHAKLERQIAQFKNKPDAIVFSTGWQANVGMLDCLLSPGDVVFCDRLSHASILDGCRLSGARLHRFNHNDPVHLRSLLEKHRGKHKEALIITESVFSMDGDIAPLKKIAGLKAEFDCSLMVDEAHATGIFGKERSGVVEQLGLESEVDVIMGTFSKALAGFGAYAAVSVELKEYMINTCRSYIYSTALPPCVISINLEALRLVREEKHRADRLLCNANWFRSELQGLGIKVLGNSQILPLIPARQSALKELCANLREKGWWVYPVRPPTVPRNSARIRVSLSYDISREELELLRDDIARSFL